MSGQYEIVLRFALPPRDVSRFGRVTEFEEKLSRNSELYELDGHDCSAGCMSIRLFTNDPSGSYEAIRGIIPDGCCDAGYRPRGSEANLTSL